MEQRKQQIEADEAFARALEKEFELKELTVSQAGASGAPATTAALTTTTAPATSTSQAIIPAEKKKEMPPPPPPAPKQSLKRSKPDTKGEDAAAKRQKMQQAVTEKSGRFERRKRKEEERKERLKKDEEVKKKRMKKVEERIEEHFNEVRLIQSAITRSAYIPFTPEEFEACQTQALIDTCSVTLKEMTDSKRYPGDEADFIRKQLNSKLPQFNIEINAKFKKVMKELTSRSEDELVVRRNNHPDAREIEQFISDELLEMWLLCKEVFIKAYYYWQVVPYQDVCSRMDALNNFLCYYNEKLRREIFTQAELADPKPLIIKVPAVKEFPMPFLPNFGVPNRRIIDEEVDEALRMESRFRPNQNNLKSMEEKVLSAYYLEEEKEEKEKEEKDKSTGDH